MNTWAFRPLWFFQPWRIQNWLPLPCAFGAVEASDSIGEWGTEEKLKHLPVH